MPLITLKYLATFSNLTGRREEKLRVEEGSKLRDLMSKLYLKYGRKFEEQAKQALIILNGRQADLNETLSHGDEVVVSYPVGGGARY